MAAWVCLSGLAATSTVSAEHGVVADAQVSYRQFRYTEYTDGGSVLDRESGGLTGTTLGFGKHWQATEVRANASYFGGTVDYDGRTNTGLPLATHTSEEFIGAALQIKRILVESSPWQGGISVGYGWQRWNRDIHASTTASGVPVSALFERYQWQHISLGAQVNRHLGSGTLELAVDAVRTASPRVTVAGTNGLDSITLRMGTRWGALASLRWRHVLTQRLSLIGTLAYEYYEFGRSATAVHRRAGVPAGTVFEPRSETSNITVGLGLEVSFTH